MSPFAEALLTWYDRHARDLPWRMPPERSRSGERPDPYHVWLSEVMLQQTTVAAVKPYFTDFLSRWPDVDALANAASEDVMSIWAGLGYYSRARNLKACADMVASEFDGRFPETAAELRKLPGIGDYTSAAIASIAFGEAVPVVDGNVERVVARQTTNATPAPALKEDCRTFLRKVLTSERPGDFAQASMDLGATICTARKPACVLCPVSEGCEARKAGTQEQFPVKAAKKKKPTRRGAVFVARNSRGELWLVQRPPEGLLGGMAALPSSDWSAKQDGETGKKAAPFDGDWQHCGTVRHVFTHFSLELEVWTAVTEPTGAGRWAKAVSATLDGLPTVMRKAAKLAIG